ncbi:MAG: hypothetical protein CO042_03575 [Parcubacteria group bacterium CG_4_9_14_0_2_um_filter_41_8]|nr:MAG: hypothetical protein CO042_03575 [Parcubacteria group bacterium CG_4_9_14_0_2_um_filter_41_8]
MPEREFGYIPPEDPKNKESEKPSLIKGTMRNKELLADFESYKASVGKEAVPESSPEEDAIRTEWLLQHSETSPEINNEASYAISREHKELSNALLHRDRERALNQIERLRGLLDKLEQGVKNISQ